MKHLLNLLAASFPLVIAGCTVPNESAIHILQAFPLQTTSTSGNCAAQTVGITRGSLDISGSLSYYLQFQVTSTLEQLTTTVSGETLSAPDRNTYYANQILHSHATIPRINAPDEVIPILLVLPPGSSSSSFFRDNLITANLAQRLIDNVRVGDTLSLSVTLQLQGSLASGANLNSNKVTFPITVYNSGFSGCTRAGDVRVPSGPCGLPGGQDGSLVACCKDFTTAPPGCPTGP